MTSRRSRVEVIYGKCRVSDPTLVGFNKEALIYPSSHVRYLQRVYLSIPLSNFKIAKNAEGKEDAIFLKILLVTFLVSKY